MTCWVGVRRVREIYLGECVGECAFEEHVGQVEKIGGFAIKLIRQILLG